jgi:hypothetical protein
MKYSPEYHLRPREKLVDSRDNSLCYVVHVPAFGVSGFARVLYKDGRSRLVGPNDQNDYYPYVKL